MKLRTRKRLAYRKHLAAQHWQSISWISAPHPLPHEHKMANGDVIVEGPNESWGVVWSGWSDEECRRAATFGTHRGPMTRGEHHVDAPRPRRRPAPPRATLAEFKPSLERWYAAWEKWEAEHPPIDLARQLMYEQPHRHHEGGYPPC